MRFTQRQFFSPVENAGHKRDLRAPSDFGENPPIILLVDDDRSVLEGLRRVFAQEGMHAITANSGEQALEQLQVIQPDLIITDLGMGAVSGWDLVFHHHLHETGLPFFVITGLSLPEAGGIEKLAEGFFQKPLNLDELLRAVRDQLGSSKPNQPPA